jgi:hypothetical protein
MMYRRPGFLADLAPPPPPSPLPSISSTATHRKSVKERQLAEGKRRREGVGDDIRWQESLLFYKSFNTLWFHASVLATGEHFQLCLVY